MTGNREQERRHPEGEAYRILGIKSNFFGDYRARANNARSLLIDLEDHVTDPTLLERISDQVLRITVLNDLLADACASAGVEVPE